MTLFLVVAALLVVLGLSIVWPLLRRKPLDSPGGQREANIAIARDRQASLNTALQDGEISQLEHARALAELEQTLAADFAGASPTRETAERGRWSAILLVILFVPATAVWLYQRLGSPQALDPAYATQTQRELSDGGNAQAPALAELIPRLEARLAAQPDDLQGWLLLGRTHMMTGAYAAAVSALRRAVELEANDTAILVSLAEAIAMVEDGALAGEPVDLLDRALALDDSHVPSRWLRAVAHQQAGEHQQALDLLADLKKELAGNAAALAGVEQMLARSRNAIAAADAPARQPQSAAVPDDDQAASNTSADTAEARLTVTVRLGEAAAAAVSNDQVLFVYARALDGPPMPVAVERRRVADLPLRVVLDQSSAILPQMTLSRFTEVTVGARVSPSGDATPASGDWFGEVSPVAPAVQAAVSVTIDRQVP